MALIKCPECGEKISSKAASCPHCGFPFEPVQRNEGINEQNAEQTGRIEKTTETKGESGNKKSRSKKMVLLLSLAVIVIGAIVANLVFGNKQPSDPFAELYYGKSREEVISKFGEPTYTAYNEDKSVQSDSFSVSFLGYETSLVPLYGDAETLMAASVAYRCEPDSNTGVSESRKAEASKYYSVVYDYCIETYGYTTDTDRRETDSMIMETYVWRLKDGSAVRLFYMQTIKPTMLNGRTEISLLWAPPESVDWLMPD